jgi:two-component system, cell cycle response regulator
MIKEVDQNGLRVLETMVLDDFGCVQGTLQTASGQISMRPSGLNPEAKKNLSILIVEDNESSRKAWKSALKSEGYGGIYAVGSAEDAIAHFDKSTPHLVLIDLNLGYSKTDGFNLMNKINFELRQLTDYVVITGSEDDDIMGQTIGHGVLDFIKKPVGVAELRARVERALVNKFINRGYTQDPLTGLGNKRTFLNKLDSSIRKYGRDSKPLSLIMMDVDKFKLWNDQYGHLEGDYALRTLGNYLQNNLREDDIAVKYGRDEFGLVLPNTDLEQASYVFERRIRWEFGKKIFQPKEGVEKKLTFSAGIASLNETSTTTVFPNIDFSNRLTPEEVTRVRKGMISAADWGLYQAKESGRDRHCPENGLLHYKKT